jgi:hypothetical protein
MFSLELLCDKYIKDWQSENSKHILNTELLSKISKEILGGKHGVKDNFTYKISNDYKSSNALEQDIFLISNEKYVDLKVAAIPVYYYIAAVYKGWTIDNIQMALKEVVSVSLTYRFPKHIFEEPFLQTIIMFNNNLSNEVELWLEIR